MKAARPVADALQVFMAKDSEVIHKGASTSFVFNEPGPRVGADLRGPLHVNTPTCWCMPYRIWKDGEREVWVHRAVH